MLRTLWAAKGGSGTTVVTVALAVLAARQGSTPVLVVDLAGDVPAAAGIAEPPGPGATDWLASDGGAAALDRLTVDAGAVGDLAVLARGSAGDWPERRDDDLAAALSERPGLVLVDAGTWAAGTPASAAERCGRRLAGAGRSTLVVRPCFLGLRRAVALRDRPDDVVVVADRSSALDSGDVASLLQVPVAGEVPVDPAVARTVDAGSLAHRVPRVLATALGRAA